ncbi:YueI family protein [Mesobacillus harenae]|uniref:YueI family protein n=1 Tax=Mesobacillus harenae TaxID=2213203 RepID=UPI0015810706|nr:YueI family protein [Mesobacillus harenae]
MDKTKVDEYLQQGMYGAKQTKPDERRKFLSTLRERVVIALTQSEVRTKGIPNQVDNLMKENREAHLFLNGNMDYSYLSKYVKLAKKLSISYTLVTNQEHDSELGMVLAYDHAIDKEDIYLTDVKTEITPKAEQKKGLLSFVKKIFK